MEQGSHIEYCGFGRRLLAHVIDTLLFTVLIVFPIIYLVPSGNFEQTLNEFYDPGKTSLPKALLSDLLPMLLVIYFWVRFRGTPGKRLLGCQIVDATTGDNLSVSRAVIRYLGYIISLLPLGLGFLWILWDKRKQGFHDKLARSVVILAEDKWRDREADKSLETLMKEAE
jgi:uncharacterized RDD family membrane protein YckC